MPTRTSRRPRLRWVALALASALLVGVVAYALTRPLPPAYTTATVATGSIAETWSATGTITRVNQVSATFGTTGEVTALAVQVGDEVTQGQTLATLDPSELQLAVVQARASVAQAYAQLDADLNATTAGSTGSSAASAAAASAAAQARALAGLQAQVAALTAQLQTATQGAAASKAAATAATQQRDQLVKALSAALAGPACTAVFAPQPAATPTPTPTPSAGPSGSASPSASAYPSASPSASTTPSSTASASPSGSASPGVTASPLTNATTGVEACLAALQAVGTPGASAPTTGGPTPAATATAPASGAAGSGAGASGTTGGATASGSTTTGSTSNEARVATDRANLLQAQQQLSQAEQALEGATLTAPITGRVGALTFADGLSSAGKSATIVGTGAAELTLQAPLAVRPVLAVNQKVSVAPPGSALTFDGTVTRINDLPTSTTSGSPTYTVLVTVSDPDLRLYPGSLATAVVSVGSVDAVAFVTAAAVTPTGETTGTVRLLDADGRTTTTTEVTLGARGQGRVQVVAGVKPGDVVVVADRNASVPANSNQLRPGATTSATPTSRASAGAVANPQPSATR